MSDYIERLLLIALTALACPLVLPVWIERLEDKHEAD